MKNNIVRNYKFRLYWLKNELKYKIYKSILHNKNTKVITRGFIKYKLTSWKKKYRISAQKRVCIILGKNRSVYPKYNLKRHTIKKLNATCLITGLSPGKW